MKRTFYGLLTMGVALTFLGDDCGGGVINDGSLTEWQSSGELSAWAVPQGRIQKVATWSDTESGVEFLDDPTVISQDIQASPDGSCLRVEVLAKVDASARLVIQVGSKGSAMTVVESDWTKSVGYVWYPPNKKAEAGVETDEYGVNWETYRAPFTIRKEGAGRAVLVKVEVQTVSACRDVPESTR